MKSEQPSEKALWKIPLVHVHVDDELRAAVDNVVESGWWSTGPRVEEFEREFAGFVGVKFALAVANGTAALHLALLAAGVGPGDEVVLPSLNFVAAGHGISIVPAALQRMQLDGVSYRRLTGAPRLKAPLNLVSRRGDGSAVVRQFINLVRRAARDFAASGQ